MQAQLGDLVRDRITGFTGIVIARTEWINKCVRITIQPNTLDKDGKFIAPETMDVDQVVVTEAGHYFANHPEKEVATGGPQNDSVALRR